jgi:two-component system chemotaxis sensor kinase CheA
MVPHHTNTKARVSAVGIKMATGTSILILAVAIGVYQILSSTQRENLLRAKEMSATAVTRLFVDSCVAGVVFGDDQAVRIQLDSLGHNDDVEYAAVWAADPSGKLARPIGELERKGPKLVLERVPPSSQLVREVARVRIAAPLLDQEGKVVGAVGVAFSLAPENQAIEAIKRSTLLASGAVALALVVLLIAMTQVIIVGPLRKLVNAAKAIGEGEHGHVDIHSRDEVGELAGAFREMSVAIRDREERIQARNRDIRMVLDNVGQGFITLDLDGSLSSERSRVVDEWFGAFEGGTKFWDFLSGRVEGEIASWFKSGWSQLQEGIFPLELTLDQLPKVAHRNGCVYELAYRPILKDDNLSKLIVVIDDITARVEREKSERSMRETMNIFRRMLSDRSSLDDVFSEISDMMVEIEHPDLAPDLLRRHVHTIKGNAALFGLETLAALCHRVEDNLRLSGEGEDERLTATDREELKAAWAKALEMREQLTRGTRSDAIHLDQIEYDAFLAELRRSTAAKALLATAESWRFEPAAKRLSLVAEQIQGMVARMKKAPTVVECLPTTVRLPPEKWKGFWSAFAHVVRNTVDHGIEGAEERRAANKPEAASVKLALLREGDAVVVSIRDDGKGIDWNVVAARARGRSLPCASPADLQAALFTDGLSTRTEVTSTSGRGVGLSVVRKFVTDRGGSIEVSSLLGRGTEFRFKLPLSMLS